MTSRTRWGLFAPAAVLAVFAMGIVRVHRIPRSSAPPAVGLTNPADVPSSGPSTFVFASQWRQEGNSVAAKGDLGRWGQTPSGLRVVTAASTGISGWPTTNVLRVPSAENDPDGANLRMVLGANLMPDLAIGSTRYYRVYNASTLDDDSIDDSAHPVENQGINGVEEQWAFITWWINQGTHTHPGWTWGMFSLTHGHAKEATGNGNPLPAIIREQYKVHRIEWALTRTNTSNFTYQARLYDEAVSVTTPVADENDLFYGFGSGFAGRVHNYSSPLVFRELSAGSNQGGWMPIGASPQGYQAAFAVSDETWCGAYNHALESVWAPA